MVKLANFAKQTVPEEHEYDQEAAVNKRIGDHLVSHWCYQ